MPKKYYKFNQKLYKECFHIEIENQQSDWVFVITCYAAVQQTKKSNSLHLRFETNLKIRNIAISA